MVLYKCHITITITEKTKLSLAEDPLHFNTKQNLIIVKTKATKTDEKQTNYISKISTNILLSYLLIRLISRGSVVIQSFRHPLPDD